MLWWILVGLIAGVITGKLMKGSGYGIIMDILVAILGAVILTWIVRLITGNRSRNL